MIVCEKCNTEYSEDLAKCPSCGADNPIFETVESDEEAIREVDLAEETVETRPEELDPLAGRVDLDEEIEQPSLVPVFRAPNETVAMLVKGLLEGEGIPVEIDSRMVPWLDGIMKWGEGFWGDLTVPESEAQRSRDIIKAYEESAKEEGGEGGII